MTADDLIANLALLPHPEGGYYREIFRSPHQVDPRDGRGLRSAFTLIHFLLREGETSAWHRVLSDESWHWSAGAPLELLIRENEQAHPRALRIGPPDLGEEPVAVVPAGHWQSARSFGEWTLVQCGVAPGFDFEDFTMR